VNGWLVNSKPSIDIVAKEANGIIKSTLISNGQEVLKGQVLIEISRNVSSLLNGNYQQQFHSLMQQRELLEKRQIILVNKYQQQESQNDSLIHSYQQHLNVNIQIEKNLNQQVNEASVEEAVLLSLLQVKAFQN